ncbi:transporter substrate-binding domain-containing protein [Gallaecimonas sp. GXIMD4217]|uniref:transporter substrate-binding domain-containing protein n=1 Tax=Gallaecimonas sp. GXIMD4217 TaxID=3131927 RepID=UPI00311AD5D5
MPKAAALLFSAVAGLLYCGSALAKVEPKALIVATETTYRPFAYVAQDGQVVGIDIEIARALCRQIKRICDIQDRPFDSLLDDVEEGRVDMAIAALDITSERRAQVAFSDPYYRNEAVYVTLAKLPTASALGGDIGVQNGSSHMAYLIAEKKWNIIHFETYSDALQALKQGRISAVFADRLVATAWLENRGGQQLRIVGNKVRSLRHFGRGMGIAVNQDNEALLELVNDGLDALEASGELERILERYMPGH